MESSPDGRVSLEALAVLRVEECCALGADTSKSSAYAGPSEGARFYSFTSVAATSKVLGNVSPSAFAVFLFRRNSIFVRFLDRKISRVGTLQNLIYENSRPATHRNLISSIGH